MKVLVLHIIKSKLYSTQTDQNNSLELVKLLFKHIFHKHGSTNAKHRLNYLLQAPTISLAQRQKWMNMHTHGDVLEDKRIRRHSLPRSMFACESKKARTNGTQSYPSKTGHIGGKCGNTIKRFLTVLAIVMVCLWFLLLIIGLKWRITARGHIPIFV